LCFSDAIVSGNQVALIEFIHCQRPKYGERYKFQQKLIVGMMTSADVFDGG
jgi:hypothetical protein